MIIRGQSRSDDDIWHVVLLSNINSGRAHAHAPTTRRRGARINFHFRGVSSCFVGEKRKDLEHAESVKRERERDSRSDLTCLMTSSVLQLLPSSSCAPFLSRSLSAGAFRIRRVRSRSRLSARVRAMATANSLSKITIKRNGDGETEFDAYVMGDAGSPGIVVLQEWWGVDYEVKNHAATIANKGFRTLIPDLYRGKVGLDAAEAHHLMDGLDWQGAVKDVEASVKWLKENGSKKVGVTGFCMGGALSIASAVLIPEVDAAVGFYGVPDPGLADVTKVKIPVQAHFGELDKFVGFADVGAAKALEEKLKQSGAPSDVHIYPNVGHAFMNASPEAVARGKGVGFEDFNKEAVDLAWSRFNAWFTRYLSA